MPRDDIRTTFDRQAASYDQQWIRLAALRECLHLLTGATLSTLPEQARILCVGAGTGAEILYLGERFPGWSFTAVEPSAAMLTVCRQRTEAQGMASRCTFHEGYLDSLPAGEPFDAATSLLVSQFITEPAERVGFFHEIAQRLRPGGMLVSADLSSDASLPGHESLMDVWLNLMACTGIPPENIARMRQAYAQDVAVLPPTQVAAMIGSGGFEAPIGFFQAGLIHGWYARRG
jgi:tRNA (cmo5U34)-methyltransferase